jgi:hypothetical protein
MPERRGSRRRDRRSSPSSTPATRRTRRYDEVVTPYTSGFLATDVNPVTNIVLQDKCPSDTSEHLRTPSTRQRSRSP